MSSNTAGKRIGTIWIVEDDPSVRSSLMALLADSADRVESCESGEQFLSVFDGQRPACLVVDERLPGISGTELLNHLASREQALPSILISGYATTPLAVKAMRAGAVTVLEKPSSGPQLQQAAEEALQQDEARTIAIGRKQSARNKISRLGENERQVLQMVFDGLQNKQIAGRLGVCVRTVEARRSRIYQMMEVTSVAQLVRTCIEAGVILATEAERAPEVLQPS